MARSRRRMCHRADRDRAVIAEYSSTRVATALCGAQRLRRLLLLAHWLTNGAVLSLRQQYRPEWSVVT